MKRARETQREDGRRGSARTEREETSAGPNSPRQKEKPARRETGRKREKEGERVVGSSGGENVTRHDRRGAEGNTRGRSSDGDDDLATAFMAFVAIGWKRHGGRCRGRCSYFGNEGDVLIPKTKGTATRMSIRAAVGTRGSFPRRGIAITMVTIRLCRASK